MATQTRENRGWWEISKAISCFWGALALYHWSCNLFISSPVSLRSHEAVTYRWSSVFLKSDSMVLPGRRRAGLWEQSVGDTVTHTHHRADAVLLWCLQLKLLAEAAVPEPTLEEDMGNEETCPLSPVFTGTETGECVFVHASVCLSFIPTDGPTDCQSP